MKAKEPTRAGPYAIEGLLGHGGMGDVYSARHPDGSRVAAKRLAPDAAKDENLRRRFQREARAAQALDHPTIVQVFDIFEDETGHWIVMELAHGETLQDVIDAEGPLPPARLLPLVRRIAEGLAEAHEKGIVHRDLKTENVVVTPEGGVKILDFGLAKHLFRDESGEALTTDGTMVGTCRSMSPEQALGEDVDHRSDLFSLGILMYEALTGTSPFVADTPLKTVSRLVGQPHRPISEKASRLPGDVIFLVERLLEKDRDERPDSAREVIEMIDALKPPPRGLRAAVAWLGSRLSRQ